MRARRLATVFQLVNASDLMAFSPATPLKDMPSPGADLGMETMQDGSGLSFGSAQIDEGLDAINKADLITN